MKHCTGVLHELSSPRIGTLSLLSLARLSKSLRHGEAERSRVANEGDDKCPSSASIGLRTRIHRMPYSLPHVPYYTSKSPSTPSGSVSEPGCMSDDEWNLRAGEWLVFLEMTFLALL